MTELGLFKPHRGQRDIIEKFVIPDNGVKWATITTGRQFGKTLLAQNSMIYWLWNNPGTKGGWISPYHKQTQKVMDEMVESFHGVIASSNRMERRITLQNGSELNFLSAENFEAIRGFTFDFGIMDEAAFIKPEALKVIRPTFVVKGKKIMIISTPWIKNWFFDYFQLGYNEEFPEYTSFKAKSTDNPLFPYSEIESAKETLTEEEIKQEYYAEFSDNAGGVFLGFDDLLKSDSYVGSYADPCFLGVDIALGGKDSTVACIMDGAGKILNMEVWKESITDKQIQKILMICDLYNIKRGYIEMNQERGIQQNVSRHFPQIKPWETTRKTKPLMIQNLKKDIEDGMLELPSRTLDPTFFYQFANFTYKKKDTGYIEYSAPEGQHDDYVIAVALANEARVPNRHRRDRFELYKKLNNL